MQYKKLIKYSIIVAMAVAVFNEFIFAADNVLTSDAVLDGALNILVMIQKYSWPVAVLVMIYALYNYYVIGSEVLANKVKGQKLVLGISIFMVITQALPLIYALFIV